MITVIYFAYQAGHNSASNPSTVTTASSTPSPSPTTQKETTTLTIASVADRLSSAGLTVKNNGKPYLSDGAVDGVTLSINDSKARVDAVQYKDAQAASTQTSQYGTAFSNGDILIIITNDINTGSTTVDSSLVAKIKSALQ